MSEEMALRRAIVEQARWMNASGLAQGTSGNISARLGKAMLVTPSAVPYEDMTPEMIPVVPLGDPEAWRGLCKPSSEWRFHRDILAARPEIGAVVHTHSTYATALAMCRREIRAAHYMIAAFGGPTVRCADYATFGTQALSDAALAALEGRTACLLANHGAIACGPTLARAMWLAAELETLACQYVIACGIGAPAILSDDQIAETAEKFAGYGRN